MARQQNDRYGVRINMKRSRGGGIRAETIFISDILSAPVTSSTSNNYNTQAKRGLWNIIETVPVKRYNWKRDFV